MSSINVVKSPALIICMGVSGSGKSTCGRVLAENLDLAFIEADDLHSPSNKQKMGAGEALTDADRGPWMAAVCDVLKGHAERGQDCVLAHSALRKMHREQLRQCGLRTLFLHIDAPREVIAQRLGQRQNHYMKADLLDSQLSAFQSTESEADILRLNSTVTREELMAQVLCSVTGFIAQNPPIECTGS